MSNYNYILHAALPLPFPISASSLHHLLIAISAESSLSLSLVYSIDMELLSGFFTRSFSTIWEFPSLPYFTQCFLTQVISTCPWP